MAKFIRTWPTRQLYIILSQAQRKEEALRAFDTRSFDGFLERLRRRRPKSELFLPILREAVKVRPPSRANPLIDLS